MLSEHRGQGAKGRGGAGRLAPTSSPFPALMVCGREWARVEPAGGVGQRIANLGRHV